jgi:AcrR family transcriptional regulator
VVSNQRGRIAAGMIEVVVARGFVEATVSQVVAAAGVGRRTFYNYYSDKSEAFFDVYGQVTDFLTEAMIEAGRAERGGWAAGVRAELGALLDCLATNPDLVRFTLEAPQAAGGEAAAAYRAFLERLLEIIGEGRPIRTRRPPPAAEYGVIGGLTGLVIAAASEGGAERITALLPEVTELVLTPYLGRELAVKAARAT